MLLGVTLLLPRHTISLHLQLFLGGKAVLFQVFSTLVLSEMMGKAGRLWSSVQLMLNKRWRDVFLAWGVMLWLYWEPCRGHGIRGGCNPEQAVSALLDLLLRAWEARMLLMSSVAYNSFGNERYTQIKGWKADADQDGCTFRGWQPTGQLNPSRQGPVWCCTPVRLRALCRTAQSPGCRRDSASWVRHGSPQTAPAAADHGYATHPALPLSESPARSSHENPR